MKDRLSQILELFNQYQSNKISRRKFSKLTTTVAGSAVISSQLLSLVETGHLNNNVHKENSEMLNENVSGISPVNFGMSEAHSALLTFCEDHAKKEGIGPSAGIGISIDLIRRLIELQAKRLSVGFKELPSNSKFKNLDITFSGSIDTNNTSIIFENIYSPDGKNYFPVIKVNNIVVKIDGYLDKIKVVNSEITFFEMRSRIVLEENRLAIKLFNFKNEETSFLKLWERDITIKNEFTNKHAFNDSDWSNLEIQFKAINILTGGDIANAFTESINLPDIFKIFEGIKFGQRGKLEINSTGELLMFTAQSTLNFGDCPQVNPKGGTFSESRAMADGTYFDIESAPKDATSLKVESKVSANSPNLNYPSGNSEPAHLSTGDLFLFTPIKLLEIDFGIVKPAVNVSDSGRYGPIYWRYTVAGVVKGISLKLLRAWPIEFQLSLPSESHGQAGAGVKIGCIRYEAAGFMFDGQVSPFEINFKIHLDWAKKLIVFDSRISQINAHDFYFQSFPRMEFPLSQILDFILAKAAETVIENQADRILASSRISIANLRLLEDIAALIPNSMGGKTDNERNVTIGVKFAT